MGVLQKIRLFNDFIFKQSNAFSRKQWMKPLSQQKSSRSKKSVKLRPVISKKPSSLVITKRKVALKKKGMLRSKTSKRKVEFQRKKQQILKHKEVTHDRGIYSARNQTNGFLIQAAKMNYPLKIIEKYPYFLKFSFFQTSQIKEQNFCQLHKLGVHQQNLAETHESLSVEIAKVI